MRHEQLDDDLELGWVPSALRFTSVVGPAYETYMLLRSYCLAIDEYRGVVDELLIFTYLGSTYWEKQRRKLRLEFSRIVGKNDEDRKKIMQQSFKNKDRIDTFVGHVQRRLTEVQDPLKIQRVQFNLTNRDGVLFYRTMRQWILGDIINESFEVEFFLNVSFMFVAVGLVYLCVTYLTEKEQGITAVWTILPMDIFVLSILVLRTLNLCVSANEYLFDSYERLLMNWQDCVHNPYQSGETFENVSRDERDTAIAWIWGDDEKPKPLKMGKVLAIEQNTLESVVAKVLALTIGMSQKGEDRQSILGFAVTPQLRTQLVASLGSVLAAALLKLPEMFSEHKDDIDKIAHHIMGRHFFGMN